MGSVCFSLWLGKLGILAEATVSMAIPASAGGTVCVQPWGGAGKPNEGVRFSAGRWVGW